MELNEQVKDDIEQIININMDMFHKSAAKYNGLDVAFATTDGNSFGFLTGTKQFNNGAYIGTRFTELNADCYQHWAVYTIMPDTTPEELFNDIIEQLEELLIGY